MNETSNIVALRQPDEIDDPLTNILRAGARQLLAQAVEIEVEAFLATVKDLKLADGRARVVRHGYGPARTIATGIGPVEVARAKIRDRGAAGDGERIRFSSAILPLWARRTRDRGGGKSGLKVRGRELWRATPSIRSMTVSPFLNSGSTVGCIAITVPAGTFRNGLGVRERRCQLGPIRLPASQRFGHQGPPAAVKVGRDSFMLRRS